MKKEAILRIFFEFFNLQMKRGKREEISTKQSYHCTIMQSLASANSNGAQALAIIYML